MRESQDDVRRLNPCSINSDTQSVSLNSFISGCMTPIVHGCSNYGRVFSDESGNCYHFNALKQYVHVNCLEPDNLYR